MAFRQNILLRNFGELFVDFQWFFVDFREKNCGLGWFLWCGAEASFTMVHLLDGRSVYLAHVKKTDIFSALKFACNVCKGLKITYLPLRVHTVFRLTLLWKNHAVSPYVSLHKQTRSGSTAKQNKTNCIAFLLYTLNKFVIPWFRQFWQHLTRNWFN